VQSFVLNINSSELDAHANRLRKMHKSALPNAIRETLSKAALNVKQDTMPRSAKKAFVNRSPNFFKANSSVDFAKGYNVSQMKATVGFIETKLQNKSTNFAVKDLEQQEDGGKIKGRSFIPTDEARTGKKPNKLVKKSNRITSIDFSNVVKANRIASKLSGRNKKQAFIRAAIMAKKLHGDNAYVLGNAKNGKRTLSRINTIASKANTQRLIIDRTPLYSYKQGRAVKVNPTNFMKRASFETQSQMNAIFIKEAQKQFERANKK
jgi:hypothetical protein